MLITMSFHSVLVFFLLCTADMIQSSLGSYQLVSEPAEILRNRRHHHASAEKEIFLEVEGYDFHRLVRRERMISEVLRLRFGYSEDVGIPTGDQRKRIGELMKLKRMWLHRNWRIVGDFPVGDQFFHLMEICIIGRHDRTNYGDLIPSCIFVYHVYDDDYDDVLTYAGQGGKELFLTTQCVHQSFKDRNFDLNGGKLNFFLLFAISDLNSGLDLSGELFVGDEEDNCFLIESESDFVPSEIGYLIQSQLCTDLVLFGGALMPTLAPARESCILTKMKGILLELWSDDEVVPELFDVMPQRGSKAMFSDLCYFSVRENYGCDVVCFTADVGQGKGNDQERFELGFYALNPKLNVIAPWREWEIRGQEDATSEPEYLDIGIVSGIHVSINGVEYSPASLLVELNEIGGRHGFGHVDMVENLLVGMKSRVVYKIPGGTILFAAVREMESLTLDSEAIEFKDIMALKCEELVYAGRWLDPLRESMDAFMEKITNTTTGSVKLKLYKGSVDAVSQESPYSLYNQELCSFESGETYDQADAVGFIRLYGLPTRVRALLGKDLLTKMKLLIEYYLENFSAVSVSVLPYYFYSTFGVLLPTMAPARQSYKLTIVFEFDCVLPKIGYLIQSPLLADCNP